MSTPSSIEQNNQDTSAETFLGGTNTSSEHDTIQFISAGNQPSLEYDYKGISKLMVDVAADDTHSIKDFLARPVTIGTVDLGDGGVGKDILYSSILAGIFRNETIQRKLANFAFMRCTFCTKIVINSQPYQTGLYYFSQRPYNVSNQFTIPDADMTFPSYNDYLNLPVSLLPHKTGFPGALLNISAVSEETIKVPYIGVTPSINLAAAFGNDVALTVVVPLGQNDNGPHAYATVYAWLEDVDLIGTDPYPATAAWVLTPQAGKHVEKLVKGEAPSQSAEAQRGPVSRVADTVGGIAKTLSRIPVVADVAGPVSWACDAVSGLGSIFGFSKPNDVRQPEPFSNDPMRNMPSCDMPSTATKMTVTRNAEVAIDSLGPTDHDELSISEVAQRPCVLEVVKWQTSEPRGTKIASWRMNPQAMAVGGSGKWGDLNVVYAANTYLSWLAGMFAWWRGGLKMTFAFAASQFHSGRLRFVVTINQTDELTPTNFDDPGHYSLVYDLRSGDTFTVEVPYLAYNYWRRSYQVSQEKDVQLSVWVEGQLVADGRAASSVGIAVLPSACSDFAVAVPVTEGRGQVPYRPPPVDSTWELTPQGFDTIKTTENPEETVLMYPRPPEHARVVATTQAFGDPITSLRTLMKRYSLKAQISIPANRCGFIMPFQRTVSVAVTPKSFVETVRSCYRFSRGGMRFLIVNNSKAVPDKPVHFKLVPVDQFSHTNHGFLQDVNGCGSFDFASFMQCKTIADLFVRFDLRGCAEVEIPYYSQYAMLDNMPVDHNPVTRHFPDYPYSSASSVVLIWEQKDQADYRIFEAAADDFSAGYLIGPPLFTL